MAHSSRRRSENGWGGTGQLAWRHPWAAIFGAAAVEVWHKELGLRWEVAMGFWADRALPARRVGAGLLLLGADCFLFGGDPGTGKHAVVAS